MSPKWMAIMWGKTVIWTRIYLSMDSMLHAFYVPSKKSLSNPQWPRVSKFYSLAPICKSVVHFWVNFHILGVIKIEIRFLGMWIFNCSSNICWKDYPFYIKLHWYKFCIFLSPLSKVYGVVPTGLPKTDRIWSSFSPGAPWEKVTNGNTTRSLF